MTLSKKQPDRLLFKSAQQEFIEPKLASLDDRESIINALLMKKVGSVSLDELYLYNFLVNKSEHLAVWKSSLMDHFCNISSLLRQCYLRDNSTNKEQKVMLDFGYVGLESKVQYMRVEINQGKVSVHFTFGERAHEVMREMSTSRVDIHSEEFVSFFDKIAEYLLSGDDLVLAGYIEKDEKIERMQDEGE